MKHYRQIIINIEVEDDLPEQKLDLMLLTGYCSIEFGV